MFGVPPAQRGPRPAGSTLLDLDLDLDLDLGPGVAARLPIEAVG
ncbi:hypothetical protein [Streptomyces noursei]